MPNPRNQINKVNDKPGSQFTFGSGTIYADKSEYIEKDLVFTIVSIQHEAGRGFDGDDRWAVSVVPADGRIAEIITFSCNAKRDEQLQAAKAHIKEHGPIKDVRLRKSGNAYYLENGLRKVS